MVDESGVRVGRSLIDHLRLRSGGRSPERRAVFEAELLPLLPSSMVACYKPRGYRDTRWINPEPDEDDVIAFRDVLAAQSNRFIRWEALHSLFVCEGNPHAFEYLKMDITDYLFEFFPGI